MAKSGRKRKKAEKSKTKLRQSIKLPKGLNETKGDISTKKITVLNQLKNRDELDEVAKLTKRKIGIKDLLHKVGSNGISIKIEGIEGITELVKIYPEICQENLSQLVNTLFPLVSFIEPKVRNASRALIQLILNKVPSNQMSPLNSIISAHVCCGLSHINTDIQLDTLKLLDIIIESSPNVVIECHEKLLPNCLDQVSLKTKTSNSSDMANRTLNQNMSGKITALKWRTDVLQRVCNILSLISASKTRHVNDQVPKYGKVSHDQFYLSLHQHGDETLAISDVLVGRNLKKKDSNNSFSLHKFYFGVYNILLDTWCEAIGLGGNQNRKEKSSGLVQASILATLEVIIKLLIMYQGAISSNSIFEKLFGQVIKNFPYEVLHQNIDRKKSATTEDPSIASANADKLNLDICYLGFQMKPQNLDFIQDLIDFLNGFTIKQNLEAVKIAEIVKTLALINDIPEDNVTKFEPIVAQLITRYVYNETVTECMSTLSASQHSRCIPSVNSWIAMLPQLLISNKVTSNHVEAIKLLFKRRNPILQEAFMKLASIPQESTKNQHLNGEVLKIVALLFPNVGVPKECMLKCAESIGDPTVKNFVENRLATAL